MSDLSHLDENGELSMVDVGDKEVTRREATAEAIVRMSSATLRAALSGGLPKGDVFTTAKVAGILAAKRTPELIPLTHPLPVTHIEIEFESNPDEGIVRIVSTVRCDGKTGVEIEAMTACSVAALTIYDMCKSAEKGIVIERVSLLRKSGGRSGFWNAKDE